MKKILVYFRYILPTVFVLVIAGAAFLPLVSFELEKNPMGARSLAGLMGDAWSQCRKYLSDPMVTKDGATNAFAWRTLACLAAAFVTSAASIGLSVWSAIRSVRILGLDAADDRACRLKRGLRRVLPGRWWMFAAQLLIVVPVMFPYLLALNYTDSLYLQTTAHSSLTWLAVGLSALSFLLTFGTRGIESELDLDVFEIKAPDAPEKERSEDI